MTGAHGATAEVGAGGDSHARPVRRLDGREGPFSPGREPALSLFAGETFDAGRPFEACPARQHRERRDEGDVLGAHGGRNRIIELHAVLDGIHAGLGAHPGAVEDGGVGRDLSPPGVHRVARLANVVDRKWTAVGAVRWIEHDLDEVGSRIQLGERRRPQLVAIFDGHRHRQIAIRRDPGARHPDVGRSASIRHLLTHLQTDRVAVGTSRRADVSSPEDARLHQPAGVATGDLAQPIRRVGAALDPMAPAGHRQVTVGIDKGGNNRRAAAVEHLGVTGITLVG